MKDIKIAAILTVFNRKEKTLACLQHLFEALRTYNKAAGSLIGLTVFLTDDGCTDGTADAIKSAFPDNDIHILQGTGSLFWAGGMRLAWQAAIDTGSAWDYYLLLNDDTFIYNHVFAQLFEADEFGYKQTGRHGLTSGITCQPGKRDEITYGGNIFVNQTKGRSILAVPAGKPQAVDSTHANILLVHKDAVAEIGIFYKGYRHGGADVDYSMMCKRRHLPVVVTAQTCGECEFDHDSNKGEIKRLMGMTLTERKAYVNSPTHSDHDYLLFVRRNKPLRFPVAWLVRTIRLYSPKLYYHVTHFRGLY
ncbi:MAG: glycosyltransferase family 2 protein [Prevotella sp.]|nr:glycosyltransferase family 2 protein [Prevotella sp.]